MVFFFGLLGAILERIEGKDVLFVLWIMSDLDNSYIG